MREPIEEFSLDGGDVGPAGNDRPHAERSRRRSPGEWRRSPWPWVTAAAVLVVAGALVSPRGDRPEPDPPPMAWSTDVQPGRAPDVWALGRHVAVTGVDGVTAFDATGSQAWTVPLDDPACTESGGELTCVYGEGGQASIATVTAEGGIAADRPFPGADVAHAIDDELIVGGRDLEDNTAWLGRSPSAGEEMWVWRVDSQRPGEITERWQDMTLSQDVATVLTEREFSDRDFGGEQGFPDALAANVATGEERSAVMRTFAGHAIFGMESGESSNEVISPLTGADPSLTDYPGAVVTLRGVLTAVDGEPLLEVFGHPLAAIGDDLVATVVDPQRWSPRRPTVNVERIDVPSGEARWSVARNRFTSCPCAMDSDSFVLAERSDELGVYQPEAPTVPHALLGIDLATGEHRWTLPITAVPDGLAAASDQVYVLSDGTLTAYTDT